MATIPTRPAIRATGLRKSFGDTLVLDGIDLEVPQGTVFALLGPNGAGKTTMVQILSTLIGADAGQVTVAGARSPRGRYSGPHSMAASSLHLGQTGKRWGSRTGGNRKPQRAVTVPPSMAARVISVLSA
jgi:ABC-type branched-subunit amino acid transport system ATPase component